MRLRRGSGGAAAASMPKFAAAVEALVVQRELVLLFLLQARLVVAVSLNAAVGAAACIERLGKALGGGVGGEDFLGFTIAVAAAAGCAGALDLCCAAAFIVVFVHAFLVGEDVLAWLEALQFTKGDGLVEQEEEEEIQDDEDLKRFFLFVIFSLIGEVLLEVFGAIAQVLLPSALVEQTDKAVTLRLVGESVGTVLAPTTFVELLFFSLNLLLILTVLLLLLLLVLLL